MGTIAAVALSAASTVFGGIAQANAARQQAAIQRQEAEHAARQQEFNAQRARVEADDIADKARDEEKRMRDQAAQVKGAQRAAIGASGFDVGSGSAMDLLRETEIIEDEDAYTIRFNAKRAQGARIAEAQNSEWGAKASRVAGENKARATNNAGKAALWGSLLSAGSLVASKWDYMFGKSGGK